MARSLLEFTVSKYQSITVLLGNMSADRHGGGPVAKSSHPEITMKQRGLARNSMGICENFLINCVVPMSENIFCHLMSYAPKKINVLFGSRFLESYNLNK